MCHTFVSIVWSDRKPYYIGLDLLSSLRHRNLTRCGQNVAATKHFACPSKSRADIQRGVQWNIAATFWPHIPIPILHLNPQLQLILNIASSPVMGCTKQINGVVMLDQKLRKHGVLHVSTLIVTIYNAMLTFSNAVVIISANN